METALNVDARLGRGGTLPDETYIPISEKASLNGMHACMNHNPYLSPFGIWNRGRKRSAWTKSNGDCAVAACWWHHGRPDLVFSHINRYFSPQTAGRAR